MLIELDQRYAHEVLAIEGMDCADCARKVEQGVGRMTGVESAAVNLMAARLAVEYDRTQVDAGRIARRVHELGYEASADTTQQARETSLPGFLVRRANWPSLAAAAFTVLGIVLTIAGVGAPLAIAPLLTAVVVGGLPLARKGLMNLIHNRSLDINALMTIAVIGAVVIGEWVEASVVVVLFAVSEALEGYAMDRARQTIRSLMSLTPPTAFVEQPTGEVELPVEQVQPGDTVIVRPGQRVPLDGVVTRGASSVDQASLTGESLPVAKETGDALSAGTLNGAGPLTMLVTRRASDSSMAKIIHLVEQAQAQRAPVQRFVDRFARVYTPAVLVLAVVMTTVPPLLGASFEEWFYRSLVLLVIACPCALVLSTPVAIVSALAAAARNGILIKGGAYLERAAAIDTIAFDKTGTLTLGQPEVTAVVPLNGYRADELLATAASIERHSEHALGRAIVRAAQARELPLGQAAGVLSVTGAGLTATYAGAEYRIGSRRMFDGAGLPEQATAAVAEIERAGGTAVLLGRAEQIDGVIGLVDVARPETRAALTDLHRAGVKRLVMLSGDRAPAARQIAAQLGLDEFRAELLPQQKLDAIAELKQSGGVVAMVGDGVNDAPALAAADLGIAMGVAGTDAALETADIALMGDDLRGLARVIALGRRAKRTIAANIAFSLGVKAIFLALALGGFATLWMAIFADVGTSLIVIANGLRLFRERR
jgi:Cd2+/Zn2+-exporting ATPase